MNQQPRPIRLVLADDDPLVREVLLEILADDPQIEVVGVAEDADQAMEMAARTRPDIALLDVSMPAGGGVRASREIAQLSPTTRVVALSAGSDDDDVRRMFDEGASAYLLKTGEVEDILRAIRQAATGEGMPIRLLLADDEPAVREVLLEIFAGDDRIEVIATAADAEEAGEQAATLRPDVALLDVSMPLGGGPHAADLISRVSPATRIVALSAQSDERSVGEMLSRGASGYLLKTADIADIIGAVHRAADGEAVASEGVASALLTELLTHIETERAEAAHDRDWRSRIEDVLSDSLRLTMVYQPIIDLTSGEVLGLEALARFASDPPMTPDRWFAAAWKVGLGPDLEMLAVRAACQAVADLPASVRLSVNLSPQPDLLARAARELRDMPLDRLVIEITEHAPVADYPALTAEMARLRAHGVRFSVDDTGAGYASLRHILRLQPEQLKLDISLVRDIDSEPAQRALTAALVAFGGQVDCEITAEGIETEAERVTLRALGVTRGQGYLMARPGPLSALEPLFVRFGAAPTAV